MKVNENILTTPRPEPPKGQRKDIPGERYLTIELLDYLIKEGIQRTLEQIGCPLCRKVDKQN